MVTVSSGAASPRPAPLPLPTATDFYVRTPLYEFYKINEGNTQEVQQIQYHEGTFDTYCIDCKQHSIFERSREYTAHLNDKQAMEDRIFGVVFLCSRNSAHRLFFTFKVMQRQIGKIGQFPSLADLNLAGIAQYRKVLGEELYPEFARAIGLASHGIGIGSFVYLRRIFERLIDEAHSCATEATSFDENLYARSRIDEKILLLKDFLPKFLVENRGLYGILSKGVHSLSEEECLQYFDTVRIGIELILDEKVAERNRVLKLERAQVALKELQGNLKK